MINIGINGLGRIGRAIFRICEFFEDVHVVAINDLNPEPRNMAYLLKYDSFYGRFNYDIAVEDDSLIVGGNPIRVSHHRSIQDVDWMGVACDAVIDAAGIHANLSGIPDVLRQGVRKVLTTYSPDEVDATIILGANEESYDPERHHFVSTSICDAVAFAPVYRLIHETFGVEGGFLKTLHPWLSYQNLLDGPSHSWAYPGELYHHYAVGRASTASIIPKPTSAIEAVDKVLPGTIAKMKSYSFRIPTPVVGAADMTFYLSTRPREGEVLELFKGFQEHQRWPILHLNSEPLVSVDFTGTDYSAVLDTRWVELVHERLLNLTLWYDNEWGYSRRVVDVLRHVFGLPPRFMVNEAHALTSFPPSEQIVIMR
jgi:glyceraldehyde 3-phosphate dehydrogenase